MLGQDDDGVADGLHGGVVVAGENEFKIAVHHVALIIVRQEVRLASESTGVLDDIVEGKLNILRRKGSAVAPGVIFDHIEAEAHPVFIGNGDQRTGQEFILGLGNSNTVLVKAKTDGFSLTLSLPLLLGGIEVLVPVHTALLFGESALILEQAVCKRKRIAGGINRCIHRSVREGIRFPFHVSCRRRIAVQDRIVEHTYKKRGGRCGGGIRVQILRQSGGSDPQRIRIFILADSAGCQSGTQHRQSQNGTQ